MRKYYILHTINDIIINSYLFTSLEDAICKFKEIGFDLMYNNLLANETLKIEGYNMSYEKNNNTEVIKILIEL